MNRGKYKIRRNRATDLLFMYLVLKKGAFRTQHTEKIAKTEMSSKLPYTLFPVQPQSKVKVLRLSMCRTVP